MGLLSNRRRMLGGCSSTIINGYRFVDLGLSVNWATCNIGVTKPEKLGWYFQWGGVIPYYNNGTPVFGGDKTGFGWIDYPLCEGTENSITKYCTNSSYGTVDNKTILEPEDDAAQIFIGKGCRMPTSKEYKELIDNCIATRIDNYNNTGVYGILFTSKNDSTKSIFIPAPNTSTNLWTSTVYPNTSYAYSYVITVDINGTIGYTRNRGFNVRGVLPK